MRYFYGPVPSRRLGYSLGVDLFPQKICSFNCVYCQLGKKDKFSLTRRSYVNFAEFKRQLRKIVVSSTSIDYITLSGSGEPTLHAHLDKIIDLIKKVTKNKYKVCVITNSSLLHKKQVRRELTRADLIIPSLDAATEKTFKKINQPCPGVSFTKTLKGIVALREEFKGKVWLEIMLVKGMNDSLKEAEKFKQIIKKINPDKVQLMLPVRAPAKKEFLPAKTRVMQIKKILGDNVEADCTFSKQRKIGKLTNLNEVVISFLKRRPATLIDLVNGLNVEEVQIKKVIAVLKEKGKVYKKNNCFIVSECKND